MVTFRGHPAAGRYPWLTSWHNALVQPLPVPCPAHLIPDATGTDAFHDAYRIAMAHSAVFVAIESERRLRWTVKADTLTAGPGHTVTDAVNEAVRDAIARLVRTQLVASRGLDAAVPTAS